MENEPVLQFGASPDITPAETAVRPAGELPKSSLTLEALNENERSQVLNFVDKINLDDTTSVLSYGSQAQAKIAQFSDAMLSGVRTNDIATPVGASLANLVVEIKSFDGGAEEPTGLAKLFSPLKSFQKRMELMRAGYAKVETNVDKITSSLEGHQRTLLKDIKTLDTLYENNHQYFKEITMYIIAGQEKLKRYREEDIPKQAETVKNGGDEVDVNKLNAMTNYADRFEKKLHDLKLSRTISIQMAPQIRLLQNNDSALVEKIQSSIVNAIPLWKNQILIALGLANSKAALEAQRKVTDLTNELLVKNSEMLKLGTVEVAKESERSIVSIDTIRKTNENLISTINEVLDIQKQGRESRAAAETELVRIESQLRQAMLTASQTAAGSQLSNRASAQGGGVVSDQ
jgi:uncharacterized protein YaaN involved in tellurite resistance